MTTVDRQNQEVTRAAVLLVRLWFLFRRTRAHLPLLLRGVFAVFFFSFFVKYSLLIRPWDFDLSDICAKQLIGCCVPDFGGR